MTVTPIETPYGPFPVPIPRPGPIPPLPHIANPLPELGAKLENTWDDVAGWVSSGWHSVTGFLSSAATLTIEDVQSVVDTAINYSQTAWSTFISIDEMWIAQVAFSVTDSFYNILNALLDVRDLLEGELVGAIEGVLQKLLEDVRGIDAQIAGVEQLVYDAARFEEGVIEAWAIDNLYHPLLNDIQTLRRDVFDAIDGVVTDLEGYANDLVHSEALQRALAIAGLATIVAGITTWVDDCGAPMCDTVGPKTDWGKWLKLFGPTAIWAMLAAVAAEDPGAIEALAEQLGRTLGPVLEAWVKDFAIGGGGFATQPAPVSGAIGGNPLGI